MPISRVITAVVECTSSVGGSPIMPSRRTPPFLGVVCDSPGRAASQSPTAIAATTPNRHDTLIRRMVTLTLLSLQDEAYYRTVDGPADPDSRRHDRHGRRGRLDPLRRGAARSRP